MKSTVKIILSIIMIMIPIFFLVYAAVYVGLPANTASIMVGIVPGISLFLVGGYTLMTQRTPYAVLPSIMTIGIGLAVLAGEFVSIGIVTIVGDPTLAQIQYFMIGFCALLGVVATISRVRS